MTGSNTNMTIFKTTFWTMAAMLLLVGCTRPHSSNVSVPSTSALGLTATDCQQAARDAATHLVESPTPYNGAAKPVIALGRCENQTGSSIGNVVMDEFRYALVGTGKFRVLADSENTIQGTDPASSPTPDYKLSAQVRESRARAESTIQTKYDFNFVLVDRHGVIVWTDTRSTVKQHRRSSRAF